MLEQWLRQSPMRRLTLLACAVFAACAADAPDDWSRIQRDRLERLHAVRKPATAMRTAIEHAPNATPQDPGHIDQREPQARAFRGPLLALNAAFGVGQVAVDIDGTRLDDRTDAHLVMLGIDAGTGAGLHANFVTSEPDLFAGQRINDGVVPAAAEASITGGDLFPHLRWHGALGGLRLPLRAGLVVDWQNLRHERAGVAREWLAVGPKLVLEPTLRLLGNGGSALDLVGHLGADVGAAWFNEEFHGGDDRDTTVRWAGEAGLGVRALSGNWQIDFGYRLQHATFGALDTDLYGARDRTELQRQFVFVGCGVTF
jgi:hypothetical protein